MDVVNSVKVNTIDNAEVAVGARDVVEEVSKDSQKETAAEISENVGVEYATIAKHAKDAVADDDSTEATKDPLDAFPQAKLMVMGRQSTLVSFQVTVNN